MADAAIPVPLPIAPLPTLHEAERLAGPSGGVLRGAEIERAMAILRRRSGLDVVVCGADIKANRALAASIESAVGPCRRGVPHSRHAGPLALPHFQQATPPPVGHTFYETENRKAKKKP
jgi:hypothetical protein